MSRKIWRFSVVIPLMVLHMILTTYFTISIPEIRLYWSRSITVFFCISVIVGWFCCSPFRRSCCNGRLTELLFNLVPVELISMLVFAQWHFVSAILLIFLFAVIEIALLRSVVKEENKCRFSRKRHRYYGNIFKRCSVFVSLVITIIPCFLVVFVYGFRSPTYEAEQEIRNRIFPESNEEDKLNAESTDDLFARYSDLFACFAQDKWKGLNVSERITVMQELVDFEASRLGISSIPVIAEKLNLYTLGQYSDETKEMWIDIEHLMESPVDECILTICHEVFHSAQYYLIENINWDSEVFQCSYFDELRSWRMNEENYKSVELSGFDAYESQPLEVSAREYAEDETNKILSYVYQGIIE